MYTSEYGGTICDVAAYECQVLDAVECRSVCHTLKVAPLGGNACRTDALDESLLVATPLHQCGNRGEQEVVLFAKVDQLRQSRHGAIIILNLADDSRRFASGEPRKVDGRLGVAGTLQYPALTCPQGEYVSGSGKGLVADGAISERTNRERTVGSRDPGARAFQQVHRNGERSAVAFGVVVDHHRQTQFVASLAGQRRHHHT